MKRGDKVFVRGRKKAGARYIASVFSDINGEVALDRPVDGLLFWNVDALVPAKDEVTR